MTDAARPALDLDLARTMLETAYREAQLGLSEGGIPIGAALFHRDGTLLGAGHNRRVQEDDASVHAAQHAAERAAIHAAERAAIHAT